MATGAPGTNGVWQYGEDDSEATFSALLNKAASTTDTQIGADRTRLTALEAKPTAGLVPIAPSSVDKSGGTTSVTSLGAVTFNGVSSVTLNGVFSSTYQNYKVLFQFVGSTSIATQLVLTSSGTPSTTSYNQKGSKITTGWNAWSTSGFSYWFLNEASTGKNGGYFEILNPGIAEWSLISSQSWGYVGTDSGYTFSGNHQVATAYNGFRLTPSGGTFTGTVQVFGYND